MREKRDFSECHKGGTPPDLPAPEPEEPAGFTEEWEAGTLDGMIPL